MKLRKLALLGIAVGLSWAMSARGYAQSNPLWIANIGGGVKAVLYKPDNNPNSKVGVIVIHRTSNYLNHAACTQLSSRGLTVLCMNSRFDNNEALVDWELIAQDVGRGVNYLKNTVHVNSVILFGHSGGGPTTTYYQAVAEKGSSYCQGPNKLTQCTSGTTGRGVDGLTKADGIVLADAHPGNTANALRAINPSVKQNQDKETVGVDATNNPITPQKNLDLFDPANGFSTTGNSNYSKNFVARYTQAQSDRMNDWIEQALRIRTLIAEGLWRFPDDDSIIIARGGGSVAGGGAGANIFVPDIRQQPGTIQPEKVLNNDGSIVSNKPVPSVRLPNPTNAPSPGDLNANDSFDNGSKNLTVKSFLSANAIRSTDSADYKQIDWCSTNNSTPCALQNISVPLLITAMGAHYFINDSEQYYLNYAASHDKDFIVAYGLVHGITPCVSGTQWGVNGANCTAVGPLTNQVKNYWDYVFNWIQQRFGT
jgi:hypothetical protein